MWLLGEHRLLCGDSTSVDDLERLCAGQMVDMWLTDPPYNVAYEGGTKDKLTIKHDSMGDDQFRQFLRDAYTAADTVMKPGAVFYIWHADSEGYNFRGAAKDAGNVLWFGTQQDQSSLAPNLVVASQVYDWTAMLKDVIAKREAGTLGGILCVVQKRSGATQHVDRLER